MQKIQDTNPATFKVGDIFYECQSGANIEARVIEAPKKLVTGDGQTQWSWAAENTQNGERIDYLMTEGLPHYGPRLYREPQYCRFHNGELVFPLLGRALAALKEQDRD